MLADTSVSSDGVHQFNSQALVDWRTGRTIRLGRLDPFGRSEYPDLNSASPARRLCAPLKRSSSAPDIFSDIRFADVEKIGQWVLQTQRTSVQLQRCGKGTITTYPTDVAPNEALTADARAVLGRDAIGYLQHRQIVYRDLLSNRRWTASWPTTQRPNLAIFARHLVAWIPSTPSTFNIYEATP